MGNGSDAIWDRANFAADRAWSEMREFLKEIRPAKSRQPGDQIVQSWDTAVKAAETSKFSVRRPEPVGSPTRIGATRL